MTRQSKWSRKLRVAVHYCQNHPERTDATRCTERECRAWLCVDCHMTHNCLAIGAGHRSAAPWTGRDIADARPQTAAHRRDDVYRTSLEEGGRLR